MLCDESWRFRCGFSDNAQWYATETIRAVIPHCASESRERLERALLDYVAPDERGIRGYRQAGRARLALLSALPAELRSADANAAVQALERKFGKDGDSRQPIAVDSVAPPIDRRAAEAMSDEQWLGAIARHRPRAPAPASRDELKGGEWELAGHLEARAAEDPDRFARLALMLPPNAHPVYLDRTLAALKTAAAPARRQASGLSEGLRGVARRLRAFDRRRAREHPRAAAERRRAHAPLARHRARGPRHDDLAGGGGRDRHRARERGRGHPRADRRGRRLHLPIPGHARPPDPGPERLGAGVRRGGRSGPSPTAIRPSA